ncbi:Putative membrane protein (modular protein) [Xanthomonas citri pv. fuscans]|nr:Putative membrane protein (modular protein) [Xanthomonas citri pv. fuscans]SOO34852.1 hypothetical protein XFF6994_470015 [Xanthomonas citri pv. fuscans]
MRQGQPARDAGCPCCDESQLPNPKSRHPMDKLIAHLVLAFLVSGVCVVLLRFIRVHGALKALVNLVITTAVVCAAVMQDGSAPPWTPCWSRCSSASRRRYGWCC